MAKIGEQGFHAGERQDDAAERGVAKPAMAEQEAYGVARIKGGQHARVVGDADDAGEPDRGEPQEHDRAEQAAHRFRPAALHQEKQEQDGGGDRQHVGLEDVGGDVQALDGGQHRDRGRDHAVPVEQGRAEQHEQRQGARRGERFGRVVLLDQTQHGQSTAFAVMIRAQHKHGVFHTDGEHHGPEYEGEDAEYGPRIMREGRGVGKHLLDGVERTGADVAEDDAQCAQHQGGQLLGGHCVGSGRGFGTGNAWRDEGRPDFL